MDVLTRIKERELANLDWLKANAPDLFDERWISDGFWEVQIEVESDLDICSMTMAAKFHNIAHNGIQVKGRRSRSDTANRRQALNEVCRPFSFFQQTMNNQSHFWCQTRSLHKKCVAGYVGQWSFQLRGHTGNDAPNGCHLLQTSNALS